MGMGLPAIRLCRPVKLESNGDLATWQVRLLPEEHTHRQPSGGFGVGAVQSSDDRRARSDDTLDTAAVSIECWK
jgi:hypothetical protein